MLRRCSRQQRSQVQTCRPFSTPCAQVRRETDSSSGIRPHVAHTGRVVSSLIRPVSTAHPIPDGIFGIVATRLIKLSTSRLVLRQWRKGDRTPLAALSADLLVMEPCQLYGTAASPTHWSIAASNIFSWTAMARGPSRSGPATRSSGLSGWQRPVERRRSLPVPRSAGALPGQPRVTALRQRQQTAALATAFGPVGLDAEPQPMPRAALTSPGLT